MKKYMVVMMFEGEQHVSFFDDAMAADNCRMDCECGMGGYAEVYERVTDDECGPRYELAWA